MSKRKAESISKSQESSAADTEQEEPPAKIAPIFLSAAQKAAQGTWKILQGQLMIYATQGIAHQPKIAGFDLDGTLITTKSGHTFPANANDWKFWSPNVKPKLRKVHEDGFKLCIFTNQKGIEKKHVNIGEFKQKIQDICSAIDTPIQVFVSIGTLNYRKPYIGMWKRLEEAENDDVQIDRKQCIYVGDAAGRIKSRNRPKADHSCADRLFAMNLGIPHFHTPEQFFAGRKEVDEPLVLPQFKPAELLQKEKLPQFDPPDAQVPGLSRPELLVSAGPIASGKSTFAHKHLAPHGYSIISQDQLGKWQACVREAERALREGKSVVIDNTNRNGETRRRYTALAASFKVPCRCLHFPCSRANAIHNNIFRHVIGDVDKAHKDVHEVAIRNFFSQYQEPRLEEGFDQIIRVNFLPEFKDEEQRRIYGMFLTEKTH